MESRLRIWWDWNGYKVKRFLRIRLKTLMWVLLIVGICYFIVHGVNTKNLTEIILGCLCIITAISRIVYYLDD